MLTVINLQPRAGLNSHVDAHLVDAASVTPSDEVVVVKYRAGRAPDTQAFAIPSGHSLHKGDTIEVPAGQCPLKDARSAS